MNIYSAKSKEKSSNTEVLELLLMVEPRGIEPAIKNAKPVAALSKFIFHCHFRCHFVILP